MNQGNYGFPAVQVVDTSLPDGVLDLIATQSIGQGKLVGSGGVQGIYELKYTDGYYVIPGQATPNSLNGSLTTV